MIANDENARRAIDNVRAMLDAMLAGGWNEVFVTGKDGDYFLARNHGTPNPLLTDQAVVAAPTATAPGVATAVKAPHVGTITWLAPLGSRLVEGDVAARLQVLDDSIDVPSPGAGTVSSQIARLNDLAEFASPLIEFAA